MTGSTATADVVRSRHGDREAREARWARRLVARLDDAQAEVSPAVAERLRVARLQAVARAREQRRLAADSVTLGGGTATLRRGGRPTAWQRVGLWLPVLLVVVGLWSIERHRELQRVRAAADIDARLLTDVLPPAAYADPGFEAFLKRGEVP